MAILPFIVHAAITEVPAEEEGSVDQQKELSREELEKILSIPSDYFIYARENRPDPFMPFISEAVVETEITEAAEELTGMRKFEPGQLTLVAIVMGQSGSIAMVQDSTGKGYIVRKGTKVGRTGEVVDIVTNKVIIQQESSASVASGQQRTVEMVLKKEGDKNP
jgi:type IV pilus assembly protein PilP